MTQGTLIGLGDMVTGSVVRVWNQAGVEPGEIPVVGFDDDPIAVRCVPGLTTVGMDKRHLGDISANMVLERISRPLLALSILVIHKTKGAEHLEDILVGDVWVLGGQSNMEFELAKVEDGMWEAVQKDDKIALLCNAGGPCPWGEPGGMVPTVWVQALMEQVQP